MVTIFKTLISKFFKAFLQAFLNVLVGKLSDTVLQIVQNVDRNTDWSNEAKRKEAFSQIKLITINNGKELKDSVINLAIETAVSVWKDLRV